MSMEPSRSSKADPFFPWVLPFIPAELFYDQKKDLRSMTSQVGGHLPELVAVSADEGLRAQLAEYSQGMVLHHEEIMDLFRRHGREPGNDKCKAMAGLIEGGNAHIASVADPGIRDLMIIAHVLRVVAYGNAACEITWSHIFQSASGPS